MIANSCAAPLAHADRDLIRTVARHLGITPRDVAQPSNIPVATIRAALSGREGMLSAHQRSKLEALTNIAEVRDELDWEENNARSAK